jgi:hypothetical protein
LWPLHGRQEGRLWPQPASCPAPDLQLLPAPALPADSTCLLRLSPQGKQASLQASLQAAEAKLEASQAQADDLAAQLAGAQATARDLSEQVGSWGVLDTTARHDSGVE